MFIKFEEIYSDAALKLTPRLVKVDQIHAFGQIPACWRMAKLKSFLEMDDGRRFYFKKDVSELLEVFKRYEPIFVSCAWNYNAGGEMHAVNMYINTSHIKSASPILDGADFRLGGRTKLITSYSSYILTDTFVPLVKLMENQSGETYEAI